MVVLSIQIFPVSNSHERSQRAFTVASSLLNNIVETMLNNIVGPTMFVQAIGRFKFDYGYEYDYEIRHFWRQLLASSRADVIKS